MRLHTTVPLVLQGQVGLNTTVQGTGRTLYNRASSPMGTGGTLCNCATSPMGTGGTLYNRATSPTGTGGTLCNCTTSPMRTGRSIEMGHQSYGDRWDNMQLCH